LGLLEAFVRLGGKGIAAPSANRFGHVSPTTAKAVDDELGTYLADRDLILDGGICDVGVESTIIDCTGELPRVLRPGGITEEMIQESANLNVLMESTQIHPTPRVSGSLERHYSPAARIFLDQTPINGQGFIALSSCKTPTGVTRLAAPKTIDEFARDLYTAMRKADELGLQEVVVEQPLGDGIAVAIRDRLLRASKGR
jgi:L-threonylcarbamoyladenylate synthase